MQLINKCLGVKGVVTVGDNFQSRDLTKESWGVSTTFVAVQDSVRLLYMDPLHAAKENILCSWNLSKLSVFLGFVWFVVTQFMCVCAQSTLGSWRNRSGTFARSQRC